MSLSFSRLLSFLCVAFFIANICAPVEGVKVSKKKKTGASAGVKTSFLVTDYFGYSDSTCSAMVPEARYFGKAGFCLYDEGEWDDGSRRTRKLAKAAASANATTTKKVKLTKTDRQALMKKLTTAQKTKIARSVVLSRSMYPVSRKTDKKKSSSTANSESKSLPAGEEKKKELKDYPTDELNTHMVGYYDYGVHGIAVTDVVYYQDTNGDLSCDPKNIDNDDIVTLVFPSNTCFDYGAAATDANDNLDLNMGYTKIFYEDTAKVPNANGVLVSLYQKTDSGKTSCKEYDTPMGNNDAWAYAWFQADKCIVRGPNQWQDDDDTVGATGSVYKLTCNVDGTVNIKLYDDEEGNCSGDPYDEWDVTTGKDLCDVDEHDDAGVHDDDDNLIVGLYPDEAYWFNSNAYIRFDCVGAMTAKKVTSKKTERA